MVDPAQDVFVPAMFMFGFGLTVTVTAAVLVQAPSNPVTLKTVFVGGAAEMFGEVAPVFQV